MFVASDSAMAAVPKGSPLYTMGMLSGLSSFTRTDLRVDTIPSPIIVTDVKKWQYSCTGRLRTEGAREEDTTDVTYLLVPRVEHSCAPPHDRVSDAHLGLAVSRIKQQKSTRREGEGEEEPLTFTVNAAVRIQARAAFDRPIDLTWEGDGLRSWPTALARSLLVLIDNSSSVAQYTTEER